MEFDHVEFHVVCKQVKFCIVAAGAVSHAIEIGRKLAIRVKRVLIAVQLALLLWL